MNDQNRNSAFLSPAPGKPAITLEDTMLIAYLKLRGHIAIPWISRDDPDDPRVSFDIEGDKAQVEADMQAFYSEAEQVGIQALSRAYKEVKSAMYSLKRIRQEVRKINPDIAL